MALEQTELFWTMFGAVLAANLTTGVLVFGFLYSETARTILAIIGLILLGILSIAATILILIVAYVSGPPLLVALFEWLKVQPWWVWVPLLIVLGAAFVAWERWDTHRKTRFQRD